LALFWPLLARSACAQLATLVAGTAVEDAELASISSVDVGSFKHCCGGHDK
jgi:hypothetical protein